MNVLLPRKVKSMCVQASLLVFFTSTKPTLLHRPPQTHHSVQCSFSFHKAHLLSVNTLVSKFQGLLLSVTPFVCSPHLTSLSCKSMKAETSSNISVYQMHKTTKAPRMQSNGNEMKQTRRDWKRTEQMGRCETEWQRLKKGAHGNPKSFKTSVLGT